MEGVTLARWSLIQVVTSADVALRRSAHISMISGIGLGVSSMSTSSCVMAFLLRDGYTSVKGKEKDEIDRVD